MADNTLVLGLDTSGGKCAVALWQPDRIVYERTMVTRNLHSTLLAEYVNSGLAGINLKPADVHLVCVTCGPGSFTGLRVGLSYAKGFCFAGEIPLIALTNFEVLAHQGDGKMWPVYTLLDARRGCYYLGIFNRQAQVLDEYKMIKGSELEREIAAGGCLVCGEKDDGSDLQLPVPVPVPVMHTGIKISLVCRLGYQKYLAGVRADLHLSEPLYIQSFAGIS
jgi:tRNA threonylcarbamoyladenosine biosynthesis protein TsaB